MVQVTLKQSGRKETLLVLRVNNELPPEVLQGDIGLLNFNLRPYSQKLSKTVGYQENPEEWAMALPQALDTPVMQCHSVWMSPHANPPVQPWKEGWQVLSGYLLVALGLGAVMGWIVHSQTETGRASPLELVAKQAWIGIAMIAVILVRKHTNSRMVTWPSVILSIGCYFAGYALLR